MNDNPENFCDRCDRENVSWFVDSDRWNMAAEALGLPREAILCPSCFVIGHEAATQMTCSWSMQAGTPFRWIEETP